MFLCSTTLSLLLAFHGWRQASFGFAITPEAAQTLAFRILAIRGVGYAFALSLMVFVVFGRSRAARGALVARYVLGVVTSVAFLRGIGVSLPSGADAGIVVAASIFQLIVEGVAVLILYGDDAADWFGRR